VSPIERVIFAVSAAQGWSSARQLSSMMRE
jgi:hypothetical protein